MIVVVVWSWRWEEEKGAYYLIIKSQNGNSFARVNLPARIRDMQCPIRMIATHKVFIVSLFVLALRSFRYRTFLCERWHLTDLTWSGCVHIYTENLERQVVGSWKYGEISSFTSFLLPRRQFFGLGYCTGKCVFADRYPCLPMHQELFFSNDRFGTEKSPSVTRELIISRYMVFGMYLHQEQEQIARSKTIFCFW